MLLLALLACFDRGPSDHERLQRALSSELPAEQLLEECLAIGEDTLRQECVLAASRRFDPPSDQACVVLTDEKWRSECLFRVAEQQALAGSLDAAITTCARVGVFGAACVEHAIDRMALGIAESADERIAAPMVLDQLRRAQASLAPVTRNPGPLVWGSYVHAWWGAEAADPADCAELPEGRPQTICRRGAEEHAQRLAVEQWEHAVTDEQREQTCLSGESPPLRGAASSITDEQRDRLFRLVFCHEQLQVPWTVRLRPEWKQRVATDASG